MKNAAFTLKKVGEDDYSLWMTTSPENRDSGISIRGTKKELLDDIPVDLDILFYMADTENPKDALKHVELGKSIIERLASFFFELNYENIEEYLKAEAERTEIEFNPPKNKVDANYYEDFIAKVIEYDARHYGKDYIIQLFNEFLKE
ncbi:hypothetical protein [Sulfurimonas indica]|uniref:hypothetical protein n=1 Tax=Sulfurimonas TaxID=202746 RepID=UPI00126507B2|nr:hypothetical protein [Sulfurimonas indica]